MKTCDNCGEKHPDRIWEVIRWYWNEAPREWGDLRRFAYATVPLYGRWFRRGREWWAGEFVRIRVERIQREMMEQDMVIQLERTDPRASALMMYLYEGRQKGSH